MLGERRHGGVGDPALLVGVCLDRRIADPELLDGDGVSKIALIASKKKEPLESESKASAAR